MKLTRAALALLAIGLAPATAQARVALVASETPELPLVDLGTDRVVDRIALPGPGSAVAVSGDGSRGFAAAGATIVAIDVNERTELARRKHGTTAVTSLAVSPDGRRLYAVQGPRLDILDSTTLGLRGSVQLGGQGQTIALRHAGDLAAVVLAGGAVAIVDTTARRRLRSIRVPGALGVAVDDGGRTLVTAHGRLRIIDRGARRPRPRAMRLPAGAGGHLALSPGRSRLAVGARGGGSAGALVFLRSGHTRRLAAGPGLGTPAWTTDAGRLFFANRGNRTLTLVSPFSGGRLDAIALHGAAPVGVVVQPGLALLRGTTGDDALTGTRGRDRVEGLGGDDLLRGGRAGDVLDGGPGADRLSGGAQSDRMNGGDGNDFLTAGAGNDTIDGGAGDDGANGGTGNDTVDGGDGDDTLDGGDGDDSIRGGDGNDQIVEQGFGNDILLSGGNGDDVLRGGRGSDRRMLGDAGDDELFGDAGSEQMSGGPGDDALDGGPGGDNMLGDEGADVMRGGSGNDRVDGATGQDRLDGGDGNDELDGGDGNDELVGGPGPDLLRGGPGDDSIRAADDSADTVDCGPGNDTVYVDQDAPDRDQLVDCELVIRAPSEVAHDTGLLSIIRGTLGADVLQGTGLDDSIFGRLGNDRLFGRNGNDYVDGEDGRRRPLRRSWQRHDGRPQRRRHDQWRRGQRPHHRRPRPGPHLR
ncbi:MAG: hypothetical protein QOJ85_146, partial [Solirubrobacteraceae bacterium]|nr:hypothetical protein [Solirubrobacteraceae bacterium]